MACYRGRVRTPKPPAEVFGYLADMSRFDEWDPGISRAEQVAGDGPGVGSAYEMDASGTTFRYEVQAHEPDHLLHAVGDAKRFVSDDRITVEPDGEGSLVTYEADLRLKGWLRIGDPVLGLVFERIGAKSIAGLADELHGTVVAPS